MTDQPPMHESTRRYVSSVAIARDYDRYFSNLHLFNFDTRTLDRWFPVPAPLIDLGCGTGRHLLYFARRGFPVTGIDLSPAMLDVAREKLVQHNLSAPLLQADLADLPLRDTQNPSAPLTPYGFTYASCMFSTLGLIAGRDRRLKTLRDINRLLIPQGRLALHVHNHAYNLWSLEGLYFLITNTLASRLGRAETGDKFLPHYRGISNMYVHVFKQREIIDLLRHAGFRIIELIPLNARRDNALRLPLFRTLRANGFLILCRTPR